jgi:uncharacterized protein YciI
MDASTDTETVGFDRFEFVLLKRATNGPAHSEEELERLQELHIAYLKTRTDAGMIRVAGPFDEQVDESLRGLCIYQTGSLERTRAIASLDPSVVAGRLDIDVMYFYCPRGVL